MTAIVAGFEVHRRQILFDALDAETGEVSRGRIDATAPAVDDVVTVSVEEILAAMRLLFERLRTVAEPSGERAGRGDRRGGCRFDHQRGEIIRLPRDGDLADLPPREVGER